MRSVTPCLGLLLALPLACRSPDQTSPPDAISPPHEAPLCVVEAHEAAAAPPRELPRVLCVERPVRVHHDPPRRFYSEGRPVEIRDETEIVVMVDQEFEVRNETPVFWIGDLMAEEYERVGPRKYKIIVSAPRTISAGAPLFLGWRFAPERRLDTGLTVPAFAR